MVVEVWSKVCREWGVRRLCPSVSFCSSLYSLVVHFHVQAAMYSCVGCALLNFRGRGPFTYTAGVGQGGDKSIAISQSTLGGGRGSITFSFCVWKLRLSWSDPFLQHHTTQKHQGWDPRPGLSWSNPDAESTTLRKCTLSTFFFFFFF